MKRLIYAWKKLRVSLRVLHIRPFVDFGTAVELTGVLPVTPEIPRMTGIVLDSHRALGVLGVLGSYKRSTNNFTMYMPLSSLISGISPTAVQ